MDNWINIIPILILTAACYFILLTEDWLYLIIGYASIYISVFIIIVQFWSFTFSLVQLLTGLMSLVVIGFSMVDQKRIPRKKLNGELIFHIVAHSLIFIILISLVYRISNYLSVALEIVLASLLILGFSVFQLGMTHNNLKIFLSIIIMFFGFELIFSANESSLLVNGLLAVVTLLVSLMGSYLIVNERGDQ